ELPGFVRGNPPSSTAPATALPLAPEAHQFFLSGEPQIADRYFPWLVNLMSRRHIGSTWSWRWPSFSIGLKLSLGFGSCGSVGAAKKSRGASRGLWRPS